MKTATIRVIRTAIALENSIAGRLVAMKTFIRRHGLTLVDVRDFVVIVLFISTLAVWAAILGG